MKKGLTFNAVAILAGIPDLEVVDQTRPDMKKVFNELIPDIKIDRKTVLAERSALRWPEIMNSPLLLIHGMKDVKAPVMPVLELDKKLTTLEKRHKLITYPDSGHWFEGHERDLEPAVQAWFGHYRVR